MSVSIETHCALMQGKNSYCCILISAYLGKLHGTYAYGTPMYHTVLSTSTKRQGATKTDVSGVQSEE